MLHLHAIAGYILRRPSIDRLGVAEDLPAINRLAIYRHRYREVRGQDLVVLQDFEMCTTIVHVAKRPHRVAREICGPGARVIDEGVVILGWHVREQTLADIEIERLLHAN